MPQLGGWLRRGWTVTGEVSRVYLFVACLPFSRYGFVHACLDMRQESWLRAHVAMFAFLGGTVPRIVPDNLKTGVISPRVFFRPRSKYIQLQCSSQPS